MKNGYDNDNHEVDVKELEKIIEDNKKDDLGYKEYLRRKRVRWNVNELKNEVTDVKRHAKAMVIGGLIAGAVAATSITIPATLQVKDAIEDYNDNNTVKDATKDIRMLLDATVKEATYAKPDPTKNFILYDQIADFINTCSDKDVAIYTLYSTYGQMEGSPIYNKITDKTIKHLKNENGEYYEGLTDYIDQLGAKDFDEYEDMMRTKIIYQYEHGKDISSSQGGK